MILDFSNIYSDHSLTVMKSPCITNGKFYSLVISFTFIGRLKCQVITDGSEVLGKTKHASDLGGTWPLMDSNIMAYGSVWLR